MSRDHLLGFPPALLALDEPVRASQRTGVARIPTPLMDKSRRELDAKLTRELDKNEIVKPNRFKPGDVVYFVPYKKLLPRGIVMEVKPPRDENGDIVICSWWDGAGNCTTPSWHSFANQLDFASNFKG